MKQPVIQQPKVKPPNCPSCKRKKWLEFDKGYYCENCENIINKQLHRIDKKKFLGNIIISQLDCHTLLKRLEKYAILWLILLIFHQKI